MLLPLCRSLLFILLFVAAAPLTAAETALDRYMAKPDFTYRYELYKSDPDFLYHTYFIQLTSQQWRSADEVDRPLWEHELQVVVPEFLDSASKRTALLIVNGGTNSLILNRDKEDLLASLALLSGSVVAMVSQIPNQPLNFVDETGNPRSEDAILAYSLDKYIETGDEEWPVHLAMTKAVVRTMDALQEFLTERSTPIDDYIVLGGSKRGWTTWLTGAVDNRVKAIVPISIDLLNMSEQFTHQWEAYGFYTPAIADYAEFDLPCRMLTEQGRELLRIIDPYEYRDRYTMPKLIINSAGDQFFNSDSSRFYFNGLLGPKQMRYTFNTDHRQGEEVVQLADLANSALQWIDDVNKGREGPDFNWTFEADGSIRVVTRDEPEEVRLVWASNPHGRDFRLEEIGEAWARTRLRDRGGGVYVGQVETPAEGYSAFAVELVYGSLFGQARQVYTTDVRITPDSLPFEGTACRLDNRTILSGSVGWQDTPLCAMVLANGSYAFSCGDKAGDFQLDIPLDDNGKATLFAFADGFMPYRQTFRPNGLPLSVQMEIAGTESPALELAINAIEPSTTPNWVDISGQVSAVDGTPLCAMVLANGQPIFTCENPVGAYDLTVPLNEAGEITVFGFADGFQAEQKTVLP